MAILGTAKDRSHVGQTLAPWHTNVTVSPQNLKRVSPPGSAPSATMTERGTIL